MKKSNILKISLLTLAILSATFVSASSFAYYYSVQKADYRLESGEFYYGSNILKATAENYHVYDDVVVELYNYDDTNSSLYTTSKITYSYTYTYYDSSNTVLSAFTKSATSGTITGGAANEGSFTVPYILGAHKAVVSATISAPFVSPTLSANLYFMKNHDEIADRMEVVSKGSYYQLKINESSYNAITTLNWNSTFVPDTSNVLMSGYSGTSHQIIAKANTPYNLNIYNTSATSWDKTFDKPTLWISSFDSSTKLIADNYRVIGNTTKSGATLTNLTSVTINNGSTNYTIGQTLRRVGDVYDYVDYNSSSVVRNVGTHAFSTSNAYTISQLTTNSCGDANNVLKITSSAFSSPKAGSGLISNASLHNADANTPNEELPTNFFKVIDGGFVISTTESTSTVISNLLNGTTIYYPLATSTSTTVSSLPTLANLNIDSGSVNLSSGLSTNGGDNTLELVWKFKSYSDTQFDLNGDDYIDTASPEVIEKVHQVKNKVVRNATASYTITLTGAPAYARIASVTDSTGAIHNVNAYLNASSVASFTLSSAVTINAVALANGDGYVGTCASNGSGTFAKTSATRMGENVTYFDNSSVGNVCYDGVYTMVVKDTYGTAINASSRKFAFSSALPYGTKLKLVTFNSSDVSNPTGHYYYEVTKAPTAVSFASFKKMGTTTAFSDAAIAASTVVSFALVIDFSNIYSSSLYQSYFTVSYLVNSTTPRATSGIYVGGESSVSKATSRFVFSGSMSNGLVDVTNPSLTVAFNSNYASRSSYKITMEIQKRTGTTFATQNDLTIKCGDNTSINGVIVIDQLTIASQSLTFNVTGTLSSFTTYRLLFKVHATDSKYSETDYIFFTQKV